MSLDLITVGESFEDLVFFNLPRIPLEERLDNRVDKLEAKHIHFAFYPRSCGRWAGVVNNMRTSSA